MAEALKELQNRLDKKLEAIGPCMPAGYTLSKSRFNVCGWFEVTVRRPDLSFSVEWREDTKVVAPRLKDAIGFEADSAFEAVEKYIREREDDGKDNSRESD